MINKKEIIISILIILLISFSINLLQDWNEFLVVLASVSIVIISNLAIKKATAYHLDSEIEIKLWEIKRFGLKAHHHFKKPVPAGAFLPLLSKLILFPFQNLVWMACLVFDVKAKEYKAAKRHNIYKFSEVTEEQMGAIAAAGITINLILAVFGYLFGFTLFSQLNIYYAFFNMLPLSQLDGNKIFFGHLVWWCFLASLTLLGVLFSILIV